MADTITDAVLNNETWGVLGISGTETAQQVTSNAGNQIYLNPSSASDNDGNNAFDPRYPLSTLAAAYAAATANQHDTVKYVSGTSSITLTASLTWAKSYTHLTGIAARSRVAQRARIFQLETLVGASPLFHITASGCEFSNFYIFQGVNDATSLVNVRVTGSRNYFENVHFAGGGDAAQAIDGGASLLISGGSENHFKNCTFGVDTISAGDGMAAVVFAATGGAARNVFDNCLFTMHAGHAGARFVETLGNSGIDRYTIFNNCTFVNLSATTMTQAFVFSADSDPANKRFLLTGSCRMIGAAEWDADNRGMLYMSDGAQTGGTNSGFMLVSAT